MQAARGREIKRYNQIMIKGMTVVEAVASHEMFDRLQELFSAIGFEAGRGWDDGTGRGVAMIAPLGNLEFVTGRPPAVPRLLVETTNLEAVRSAVERWMAASHRTEEMAEILSPIEDTHWKSRMFTVRFATGAEEMKVGFWQSENVLHGRPVAIEGDLSAAGMRFAIVTARWNAVITDRLLQGALDAFYRSGAAKADVEIVRVPGSWEVPSAARALAESKKFDAIVTLACLIRGETAHYEAIYNEVARGIGQSQQDTGIPHTFGVLTCETLEQALDRAGIKAGNKGFEAAVAAIEMVSIQRKIAAEGSGS